MNNPLLNPAPHVDYPLIKAEHIEPAISALLARARAELQAISQKDIANALELAGEKKASESQIINPYVDVRFAPRLA